MIDHYFPPESCHLASKPSHEQPRSRLRFYDYGAGWCHSWYGKYGSVYPGKSGAVDAHAGGAESCLVCNWGIQQSVCSIRLKTCALAGGRSKNLIFNYIILPYLLWLLWLSIKTKCGVYLYVFIPLVHCRRLCHRRLHATAPTRWFHNVLLFVSFEARYVEWMRPLHLHGQV